MKKIFNKFSIFSLILFFVFAPFSFQLSSLNINKKIKAENLEDINIGDIEDSVVIDEGEKFIVEAGGEMVFDKDYLTIDVYGKLEIKGTKSNPVKIKTQKTNFAIITHPGSEVIMENVEIERGGYEAFLVNNFLNSVWAAYYMGAVHFEGGNVNVRGVTFKNCSYAVTSKKGVVGELKVNYSKFINNGYDVEDENESDFTNNYWDNLSESEECKNNHNVRSCLSKSWGNFKIYPWQTDPNFTYENGASNVLFLPGIKASHLYKYDSDNDIDELWVPNWFGNDVEELKLDNEGQSVEKIFTQENDVIEKTIVGSLYESFLDDLNNLKTENLINDYKAFAYDWRQSVKDIAKNGTPYQFEINKVQLKLIQNEINSLAQNSKSGKVTIIGHSNGGLVAKAVMVEHPELAEKIDKIILVGTPQMGTPLTILSFLYGYEESLPTLLSQSEARSLVENMPGAYGLLPSSKYFNRTEEFIINFSSNNTERGKMFADAYGENIDSFEEFRDFLLAKKDSREKPESDEINFENVLNEKLLNEAIDIHDNLDNWIPPANIKVIQLAGWGLPTVSGINYVDKKEIECKHSLGSTIPVCYETDKYKLLPEPKFTSDGDAVVTVPSGLMMPNLDNLNRFWFDLERYNDDNSFGNEHANILEVSNIREVLKNEIQNKEADLPKYISNEKPADFENMEPRIKMSLYSPLDIHLYDSVGNHTGYKEIQTDEGLQRIIEENIPNSFYFQLGEVKYVGFEKGENIELKLGGYKEGAYSLKIEEVKDTEKGEEIVNYIIFKNLPSSDKTEVKLNIPASGLEDISNLEGDYDGDGDNDYVLEGVLGQEITLPDITPPVIEINSPENKIYYKDKVLDISYSVFDDKSDKDKIKTEISLNNQVTSEKSIDLSFLKTGEYKFNIKAIDEANNQSEKEVVFNIETNVNTLKNNINHFYELKLIKTSQEKKMLINNLSVIEREIEFYYNIKNNIFIKNKAKKILLHILENQIENHIDIIIYKIKQDKKNYDIIIKETIVNDLNHIRSKY